MNDFIAKLGNAIYWLVQGIWFMTKCWFILYILAFKWIIYGIVGCIEIISQTFYDIIYGEYD